MLPENGAYVGLHRIKVQYTFRDYLAQQEPLFTEFDLVVLPALEEVVSVEVESVFDPDAIKETSFNRKVGEEWIYPLPAIAEHELGYSVHYETVQLNEASVFATYYEDLQQIRIETNKTTENHVGEYKINLRLEDEVGTKSQLLTIRLTISGEGDDEVA